MVNGYKQDTEYIASIVRQEVKTQTALQVERLAKMLMKVGKVSAGQYYLLLKLLLMENSGHRDLNQLSVQARKMGVRYMQMKDSEINIYLEGETMMEADAEGL